MTTSSKSIVFEHARLERGDATVIPGFSCRLDEARIGLIGRNGSGKSTLVRSLNGLLPLADGALVVHSVNAEDGAKALSLVTGFVFQNPDHQLIFPTALEELSFGLRQLGVDKKHAKSQALAFLRGHGVEEFADRPVHELSEGQKQLICILAVLIMEPGLLVLDEPFSSLDLRTRLALGRELEKLDQQVIFVSHDLEALEDYDRILWIESGRLKMDGAPCEVLKAYKSAEAELQGFSFGMQVAR